MGSKQRGIYVVCNRQLIMYSKMIQPGHTWVGGVKSHYTPPIYRRFVLRTPQEPYSNDRESGRLMSGLCENPRERR